MDTTRRCSRTDRLAQARAGQLSAMASIKVSVPENI